MHALQESVVPADVVVGLLAAFQLTELLCTQRIPCVERNLLAEMSMCTAQPPALELW